MIILDRINGLADSKYSGIPGSVTECVGLDLHTKNLQKVNYYSNIGGCG